MSEPLSNGSIPMQTNLKYVNLRSPMINDHSSSSSYTGFKKSISPVISVNKNNSSNEPTEIKPIKQVKIKEFKNDFNNFSHLKYFK